MLMNDKIMFHCYYYINSEIIQHYILKPHNTAICVNISILPLVLGLVERNFSGVKNENFVGKNLTFFYFCSKHRLWVHVRTASSR